MSEPSTAEAYEDAREHLLDELVRVDLLLRAYVERRWGEPGRARDEMPGLYISDEEIDRILHRKRDARERLREGAPRHGERSSELEDLEYTIERRVAASSEAGVELPLQDLIEEFDLSDRAVDVLLLAVAPDIDPKYEKVYGYLRDDITKVRPTTDVLLRILTHSEPDRVSAMEQFGNRSTLRSEGLIRVESGTTLPSRTVRVEERAIAYLLGDGRIDDEIASISTLLRPGDSGSGESDPRELVETLDLERDRTSSFELPTDGPAVLAAFVGPDERSAEKCIETIAADAGIPILRVDGTALRGADIPQMLSNVRREARLQSGVIHVTNVHALVAEQDSDSSVIHDGSTKSRPPDGKLDRLIAELDRFPGDVFLSGNVELTADLQPALDQHTFAAVPFPKPDHQQRRRIWEAVDDLPEEADPAALASAFRLTRGGIEDAMASARALSDGPPTEAAVLEGCRLHSRRGLAELAQEIEPTYDWDDIVLPDDTLAHLREIAGAIRHRGTVFEEWGFADRFSLGNGINVLFSGKSGTGKTMAAEIIAKDVGLPLYKLDLSSVMSKYIGETEKNIGQVFDAAEESNAILFFDEADALFGTRTEISDSHDRYANVEVDYLLQRMEEHSGCVILASNLKENIDDAFRRRINASVNFPMPDEAARRDIWEIIFPDSVPMEEIDIEFLAGFELSGGYIKNVALTAAFLAAEGGGKLDMNHVVRALRREFQKSGRLYDLDAFGEYLEDLE